MKKYEDERINYLLEQLQEDIELDDERNYRDVDYDLNELYKNIDKVIEYTKNGCRGELYLNSNIWDVCSYTLSQILQMHNLRFIGIEKSPEEKRVIHIPTRNKQFSMGGR